MLQLLPKFRSVLPVQSVVVVIFLTTLVSSLFTQVISKALDDSEFAEFEEFDDEEFERSPKGESPGKSFSGGDIQHPSKAESDSGGGGETPKSRVSPQQHQDDNDEGVVEEEESQDEFSHLEDEDEFVNFESGKVGKSAGPAGSEKEPKLKIANVPSHLRTNWFNFQVEMIMLAGLAVYLMNYLMGKTKNQSIANSFFEIHRDLLESNFHIVGDDGTSQEPQKGVLMKESDSSFRIWCSGRAGVQGLSIQIKLQKRQDLISTISQAFKPVNDQVILKVTMNPEEIDSYVFMVGNRKSVSKLGKELTDLYYYCAEKKGAERFGLPQSFMVLSEIGEATSTIFDPKVIATLNKFEEFIDYIHVSDQYSGVKPADGETSAKLPESGKVLIFSFDVPKKIGMSMESRLESMKPLMSMVMHCIDKVRRFRLSKEAKQKAEKNRQRVQESFLKTTHAARVEAAQARKEEKIKERKEKIMAEEDPEKQKRLEKQEQKKEAKRKQPKMKQLKIKAM